MKIHVGRCFLYALSCFVVIAVIAGLIRSKDKHTIPEYQESEIQTPENLHPTEIKQIARKSESEQSPKTSPLAAFVDQSTESLITGSEVQEGNSEEKSEPTKMTFSEVFNAPVISSTKIHEIIRKADEMEKGRICDQIVERFHTDPDQKVRQACLLSLTPFPQACRKLAKEALSDENRDVRNAAAIVASWRFFTENELDALYQAVKEDTRGSRKIAQNAIRAMGLIGGEKASKLLRELWEDDNISYLCKGSVLVYLGFMNDLESFKILESVAGGEKSRYQDSALYGLRSMAILHASHLPIRSDGRNVRDPEIYSKAKSFFVNQINSDDDNIRWFTASVFGDCGEMEDVGLLTPLLSDDYSQVVSYTEDEEVKEKLVYPIRKEARESIAKINARLLKKSVN